MIIDFCKCHHTDVAHSIKKDENGNVVYVDEDVPARSACHTNKCSCQQFELGYKAELNEITGYMKKLPQD